MWTNQYGVQARHESVEMPSSNMKVAIAKVLRDEGFVKGYQVVGDKPFKLTDLPPLPYHQTRRIEHRLVLRRH